MKFFPSLLRLVFFLFLLSGGLCSQIANAQFKYEILNNAQGLSQGYIFDILQDKDGFMWFSTKDGLNRYDGYQFRIYTHSAYDSTSLSSNQCLALFEDRLGRIWVATEDNGINVYNKAIDRFLRIQHKPGTANTLSGNRIQTSFVELADGRIMVCTQKGKLNLITLPENAFEKPSAIVVEELKIPYDYYNLVYYTDASGDTWLNVHGKHMKFNPARNDFEWVKDITHFSSYLLGKDGSLWTDTPHFDVVDKDQSNPVFSSPVFPNQGSPFFRDKNERLWITCPNLNQLQIFDLKAWKRGSPIDPKSALIAEDKIGGTKMFKDRSGMLWMGTNGYGLRKYRFESEKFNHQAKGFSPRRIQITKDHGIFLKGWAETRFLLPDGRLMSDDVFSEKKLIHDIFVARNGDYWVLHLQRKGDQSFQIASVDQIEPFTQKKKNHAISFPIIYGYLEPIMEDKNGYIWMAGIEGNYNVLDPKTGQFKKFELPPNNPTQKLAGSYFTAMYEDALGTIWLGSETGIVKVQTSDILKSNPVYQWYVSQPNDKTAINHNHVSCFLDDPKDSRFLWVATKGGGLNLMDKTTGKFSHITTREGLCNNFIYGILTDAGGNIWGSTNNGLFCVLATSDKENGRWDIRHFTEAGGLQSNEFNTNAFAKLPNGDFVFGGVNGVNIFNPQNILVDTFLANIYITQLMVGNKVIRSGDESGVLDKAIEFTPKITLSHHQDIIALEFSSLDFRAPDQNKYRYKMEGISDEWIELGTRHVVTFSHLPPGEYVFKVQGTNSLGIWSGKEASLVIEVLPPFWNTWWAYLAYLAALIFAIRAYFKYRLRQNEMQAALDYEQREAKRIKELDTVKTQLYNNITHEFRTPLTVILGMVQQIRSSTAQYLDSGLEMIERNGKSLLNLVNEMLDLSKLEAGKMELHTEPGDVVNFIRYVVESFHSFAETKGVKFHYLSSLDSYYTRFDTEKLRQILSNLLSNALKFSTDNGDVYITISLEKAQRNWLYIKVKDTGSGIPEHQLSSIFDRFYQADSGHTRKAEGTGIGLALTKELVQLMNGNIAVNSPPVGAKKGSEFTVRLPLELVAEQDHLFLKKNPSEDRVINNPAITPIISHADIRNKDAELILLVEDNADVVAYTASCLPDYRLAVAKDGKEGLEISGELIPDLIITDVMMPHMDGFEMVQRMRQDEKTSHIPIIMLTAKADQESKLAGLEHGAEVYLEKPFYREELLLRIRKLLDQRRILQRAYAKLAGLITESAEMAEEEFIEAEVMPVSEIEDHFVIKVREEIEQNLHEENYNVDLMCKHLFMSYSQLHRKLSALIDLSPNQYIKVLRLKKACTLLKETTATVASIANQCGFGDAGYFGKVFKQEYGMTPQEWRNQ
jgi:signal transduction histidine kinase/CheY-like chemotaxis protein/AraC-like DNA-binding protein/ligand-binding sensor domain-containing protein